MAKLEEPKEAPPARKYTGPRFKIRVKAGARFTRVHTPYQLRFVDGEAGTNDEKAAEFCGGECGYEVTDQQTGKVRNPLPDPAAEAAEPAKK